MPMMTMYERIIVHAELYAYFFSSIFFAIYSCLASLIPRRFKRRDITGEVVLITGGGQGIGHLTARKLAKEGANVIIWDINEETLAKTKKLIETEGGRCSTYVVDVSNYTSVTEAALEVKQKHGTVDVLVNNAGILSGTDYQNDPEERIIKNFQVNILAHFWTVRSFLPDMKKRNKGQIVTISSIAGKVGSPKLLTYSTTKFAAVGFDENLRLELDAEGYFGITTTLVCPFFVNTQMAQGIKTRILGTLDVDYVASEITDGILMRTRRVIIPAVMRIMIALKGLTHNKLESLISQASIGKDPIRGAHWNKKVS